MISADIGLIIYFARHINGQVCCLMPRVRIFFYCITMA